MNNYVTARENMVKGQILPIGIQNPKLVEAMAEIPRHEFLEEKFKPNSYCDKHIELIDNRYILSPSLIFRMISYADIENKSTALDIASGTGYSTAILAQIFKKVVSIESSSDLSSKANQILRKFDISNTILLNNKLSIGNNDSSPYDLILINGMLKESPKALYNQLAENGKLVYIKYLKKNLGAINVVQKQGNDYQENDVENAYAPLIQGF